MLTAPEQRLNISHRLKQEIGNRWAEGGAPVAMLYPSPYRAGMSSVGFQCVLQLLRDEWAEFRQHGSGREWRQ